MYWAIPMAPPRLALAGSVDIVAAHDVLGSHATGEANNFSAMPSVHVGWSAWAAYAACCALRRTHPRRALLAWAFPIVMVGDVLATGNHYLLDVVGSGVLLIAAIAVARVWGRLAAHRDPSSTTADQAAPASP
jgi:membrane-associated phospholipid phosphatase